jgi:hypothetical protein
VFTANHCTRTALPLGTIPNLAMYCS